MRKILSGCPVCGGAVRITEIACDSCGTRVQSAFDPCRFCRLAPEQLQFIELFLMNRGNISNVGQELGISYPTVSKRLELLLDALGLDEENENRAEADRAAARNEDRKRILEMLDRGEITAEEATRRLRELH